MKTARKLTAIFLCIAMLLSIGATGAFAYEIGDTVEWKFTEDDIGAVWINKYPYGGTLTEGSNDVEDLGEPYSVCYKFEASKAGYYKVSYSSDAIYGMRFAESYENGVPMNHADRIVSYGETESRLFCLSKGTHMLMAHYVEDYPAGSELRIDYVAESISDVTYDENGLKDLIMEYDVYSDENTYYLDTEYTLTFSDGQTIEYKNDENNEHTLNVISEKSWVKGENAAKIVLPGYEKDVTVTVCEITDYISDIEISNLDKYLEAYEHYNGQYAYYDFGETPETVTVTYADGTKKTFEYYYNHDADVYNTYITLPNGREVHVYVYQSYRNNSRALIAGIADHEYIVEECNISSADLTGNFNYFTQNISDWIDYAANNIGWCFEGMANASSIEEFMYYFRDLFTSYYLSNIFEEISMFISYCF